MKNKELLRKIALFGKKHHFPMNVIIFEFAVVILWGHFVSWLSSRKSFIVTTCLCVLILFLFAPMDEIKTADHRKPLADVSENIEPETVHLEPETVSSRIVNEAEINDILDNITRKDEPVKADSYYIKVNRLKNCVTIYVQDDGGKYTIPVKSMICSTGGEKTPTGVYTLGQRYKMRKLLFGVYGQYATRIVGQILFHSSSNSSERKDSLLAEEFNKLGESVSHGCIRLTVGDAKWIFENCVAGTVVEIYDDDNYGPLGRPDMIKVPENTLWDPTDDDENNQWNNRKPEIKGVEDRTIKCGTPISCMYGISAKDTCGNNITDSIELYGEVDINTRGKYMVVYYVKDLIGRVDIKTAIYTVE